MIKKTVAAIDLGTNTFHLLIATLAEGKIEEVLLNKQIHVKLGEGGINQGLITEEAFSRGLNALLNFSAAIRSYNVTEVHAVGTAALRSATNGSLFIEKAKQQTGIIIQIIEGDREAELIYQGVKQVIDLSETSLIMDIGGGSVEFIFANAEGIYWKKSYPIGAAKLMEKFHHSDPISQKDIEAIKTYLNTILGELIEKEKSYKAAKLVGSAGAFETFAALSMQLNGQSPKTIGRSFDFRTDDLKVVIQDVLASTHIQRENNSVILPVRTDMIVVASILTQYVIEKLGIEKVQLSAFALKEGLLFDTTIS